MSFATFKRLFAPPDTRLFLESSKGGKEGGELRELTFEAWQNHIGEGPHIGAFVQQADGNVQLSMFDIDISPLGAPRAEMLRQMETLRPHALKAREALEAAGISRDQVLVEFSGSGYHVWVFYATPVPAVQARTLMLDVCNRTGLNLRYKPRFLDEPDRDTVWLPMRVNRSQRVRSVWVADLESFDPAQYREEVDLGFLDGVRAVEVAQLPGEARE